MMPPTSAMTRLWPFLDEMPSSRATRPPAPAIWARRYTKLIVSVLAAAAVRTGFWFMRKLMTSAIVYLPVLRSGSATSRRATIQATKKPTE